MSVSGGPLSTLRKQTKLPRRLVGEDVPIAEVRMTHLMVWHKIPSLRLNERERILAAVAGAEPAGLVVPVASPRREDPVVFQPPSAHAGIRRGRSKIRRVRPHSRP